MHLFESLEMMMTVSTAIYMPHTRKVRSADSYTDEMIYIYSESFAIRGEVHDGSISLSP